MLPAPPLDPCWQTQLDTLHPRAHDRSWLLLTWESGDPWSPVNRWIVWHMHPKHFLDNQEDRKTELEGPSPRSTGHYCAVGYCPCEIKQNAWRDGAAFSIDLRTWEIYQQYGHYAQRWWIVQGNDGGHRYRLTTAEKRVNKLLTNQYDTPAPGSLPYAPFDQRAYDKIIGFGEWFNLHALRALVREHPEKAGEYESEVNKLLGALMLKWINEKAYETTHSLTRAEVNEALDQSPVGLGRESGLVIARSMEEVEREYLSGAI